MREAIFEKIICIRKQILFLFLILAAISLFLKPMVQVNYDMNSYLPEESDSTVALNVMKEEFDGGIPGARAMIRDVSLTEALEYKEKINNIDGVDAVTWLDDSVNMQEPLEVQDQDVVETYYKDGCALYSITIDEEKNLSAVAAIQGLIGEDNAMSGAAVSTAAATNSTVSEIRKIAIAAVLFVFFILLLTTASWLEPLIVLAGLGVAVLINAGSNLMFGEISFVTNAAGSILQLAVSLDYSVFLIHSFEECRKNEKSVKKAMRNALCQSLSSILSSGLTTVIGFLALVLMRFQIGPDLGLALAKGIAISLLTVFLFMPGLILTFYPLMDKTRHRSFMPPFHKFGMWITKFMLPLAFCFMALVVPSYLASINNSYYYGSSHIFGKGTKLGDDTAAIEKTFGKNDTYVLLVPKGNTSAEMELSQKLHDIPEVKNLISYVDMAGAQVPYEYLDEDSLSLLESDGYSRMVLSVKVPYEGQEATALIDTVRKLAEQYYPGDYYLAGEGVSTYDLKNTVEVDMVKVNLIAIAAVFLVLALSTRSVVLPIILVASIETAIWLNLSLYYYAGNPLFYIAYLIISSIQLGATVDYAILFTDHYREKRKLLDKKESIIETISGVTVSVLTSGITLTVVGFLLGIISTHGLLSQLGMLLGKGTLCSMFAVLFVLPGLLYLFDGLFQRKEKKVMSRKRNKKIAAMVLAFSVGISSFANSHMVEAAALSKEEVIYGMMDAAGNVTGVYAVNILSGEGRHTDYGSYSDVRNMTSSDEIVFNGEMVQVDSTVPKLYYQGNLKGKTLPWNFEIIYKLDGKETAPEELAGKSGSLEISMKITKNKNCDDSFWNGYALQTGLLLDSERCSNITADGATVANVGSDKQLSYIILPGKEKDIVIHTDVRDFEMDGISVNAVRLNLDIDMDERELQDKVTDIQDVVSNLRDGADKLKKGAGDLKDGSGDLKKGIRKIEKALKKLDENSEGLTDGSSEVMKALKKIEKALGNVKMDTDDLTKLGTASKQIQTGIDSLVGGLKTMDGSIFTFQKGLSQAGLSGAGDLAKKNKQAVQSLGITDTQRLLYEAYAAGKESAVMEKLEELVKKQDKEALTLYQAYSASGDATVITDYIQKAGLFISMEALLKANISYIEGSNQLISGFDAVLDPEKGDLMKGAVMLQGKYKEFNTNIQSMVTSLKSLSKNMTKMKKNITRLTKRYGTLDKGIGSYTEGVSALNDAYGQIEKGAVSLAEGTADLYDGTEEMFDGCAEFENETLDMDDKISDAITDTIDEMTGKNEETVSFLSDKNKDIKSVMFVMKTAAIEKEKIEETEETQEEKISIWQKFLNLFKKE